VAESGGRSTSARSTVIRGISWNIGVGPVVILANLAAIPISIQVAGASFYGVWAVCSAAAVLLSQMDLGVGTALVRQISGASATNDSRTKHSLVLYGAFIFIVLIVVLSPALVFGLSAYVDSVDAGFVLRNGHYVFVAGGAALAFALISRFFGSISQGNSQFMPDRASALVAQIVRVGLLCVALATQRPSYWVVVIDCIALAIPAVWTFVYCRAKGYLATGRWGRAWRDRRDGTQLLKFSTPTFVSSLATVVSMQAPLYFVGALLGFEQAAVYSAITRVLQSARTLISWVTGPMLPAASAEHARGTETWLRRKVVESTLILSAVAGLFLSMATVFGTELMTAWLGKPFESYGACLAVAGLAVYAFAIYAPGVVFSTAVGRPGIVAINNVVLCLVTISLSAWLPSIAGAVGAIWSYAAPLLAITPLSVMRTSKLFGFSVLRLLSSCVLSTVLTLALTAGLELLASAVGISNALTRVALVCVFTTATIVAVGRPAWRYVYSFVVPMSPNAKP
jgi:O-antigen/teichoic acid export membrane protein